MEKTENVVNLESKQLLDDISGKSEKNLKKVVCAQYSHEVVQNVIDTRDRYVAEDFLERSAHILVDDVIRRASNHIQIATKGNQAIETHTVHNIHWPTIGEFTVNTGKRKIEEYIKTWKIGESWLYCIDFLCEDVVSYDKLYRYKVQWSIPTRRKPIPRATASVYFTFAISTIKPQDHVADVYYIFETSKLVHVPGKSVFREKWLKDIVDSKIFLMETVNF